MKCQVGDLAVVVRAQNRSNLGRIVRVIATHDGSGDLVFTSESGHIWLVSCATPMKWTWNGKVYRRKSGPVPDTQLQPIRGKPNTRREGTRDQRPASQTRKDRSDRQLVTIGCDGNSG